VAALVMAPFVWSSSKGRHKRKVLKGFGRLWKAAGSIVGLAGFSGNPYG
jgi:hypothetical protein